MNFNIVYVWSSCWQNNLGAGSGCMPDKTDHEFSILFHTGCKKLLDMCCQMADCKPNKKSRQIVNFYSYVPYRM